MDHFPEFKYYVQPSLFDYGGTSAGSLELIPQLWYVAEALTSRSSDARLAAIEFIIKQDAARLSSLISYMLVTRICDPSMEVRVAVIRALGDIFCLDEKGMETPTDVKLSLYEQFSHLEEEDILAILQASEVDPSLDSDIEVLFRSSSIAGYHLVNILKDRRQPSRVRELATEYVGRIGYLDAIPVLERLKNRMIAKQNGQKAFPFNQHTISKESQLLTRIRTALEDLTAS